ncbi:MAG: molecular chaperone DnaK [Rubricoccaceae bacterium]
MPRLPVIGLDLGTTFSAVATIDANGSPVVIRNVDGGLTTPSVIWTDGKTAYVGEKAVLRKEVAPERIVEFVKREMGKPAEIPPELAGSPDAPQTAPFAVNGFKAGPAGMSALILRKLKKEAIRHFQAEGRLSKDANERHLQLDAIISVPAYFGDVERQQTRLAGFAAGLNVVGIVNEPTAAAMVFRGNKLVAKRWLVFDLGGGTFDVTILETESDGSAHVVASDGDVKLGGKDVDTILEDYLYDAFQRATGQEVPIDRAFQVQRAAVDAKKALSSQDSVEVHLSLPEGDLHTTLHRARPAASSSDSVLGDDLSMFDLDVEDDTFYLEDRLGGFLHRCRVLCERALASATVDLTHGRTREMTWRDIDEVVLVGGSCRIPAVQESVAEWTGRQPRMSDLDTDVARGAALYGARRQTVTDVVSHSFGVELLNREGVPYLDPVITKNTPLPASASRTYPAPANAELRIYQGESTRPDEALLRGSLPLKNPAGTVRVVFRVGSDGTLSVQAQWTGVSGELVRDVPIENQFYDFDDRGAALRAWVQRIHLYL